jgi:hypothetical protein
MRQSSRQPSTVLSQVSLQVARSVLDSLPVSHSAVQGERWASQVVLHCWAAAAQAAIFCWLAGVDAGAGVVVPATP